MRAVDVFRVKGWVLAHQDSGEVFERKRRDIGGIKPSPTRHCLVCRHVVERNGRDPRANGLTTLPLDIAGVAVVNACATTLHGTHHDVGAVLTNIERRQGIRDE